MVRRVFQNLHEAPYTPLASEMKRRCGFFVTESGVILERQLPIDYRQKPSERLFKVGNRDRVLNEAQKLTIARDQLVDLWQPAEHQRDPGRLRPQRVTPQDLV